MTIEGNPRKRWLLEVAVLAVLLAAPGFQQLVFPPSRSAIWNSAFNWPYFLTQAGILAAPALYMVWQSEEGWRLLGFNQGRGLPGAGLDLFEGSAVGLTLGMGSATLAKLFGGGFPNWDARLSFVISGLPNQFFLVTVLLATAVAMDRLRRALNSGWKAWWLLFVFLGFLPQGATYYPYEAAWYMCQQLTFAAYFLVSGRFAPLIVAAFVSNAIWLVQP
ncbi:MAG: hypothetical protein ACAH95_14760 [Fimbriimonas sp.]